jgi:hypothetical protein
MLQWLLQLSMLACLLLLVSSPKVQAHTATQFFDVDIAELPEEGRADSVKGVLRLRNLFADDAFLVSLRQSVRYDIGNKESPSISGDRIRIGAGGTLEVPFQFALGGDGKYQVVLQLDVFSPSGAMQLGHQPVDIQFKVKQGTYQRVSYESLYPAITRPPWIKGPAPAFAETIATDLNAVVEPLPKGVTAVLGEKRLKLLALPEPEGTGQPSGDVLRDPGTVPATPAIKPVIPGTITPVSPTVRPGPQSSLQGEPWYRALLGMLPISQAHALGAGGKTYKVSGRFSYRGMDGNLHPGWNWFVQLWWRKDDGSWQKLASRYIPPSGNWSLSFAQSGYAGKNLLIQYRAGGYFILPQDRNNNEYWWNDPQQTNIGTDFNIGHRTADTSSSGSVPGLGDVYYGANLYWNKFTVSGVNPERSKPIRLFFPNTWENCSGNSPWSCASVGGDIWLIPAHIGDYVIQHELAHQTNNEYWSEQRPPGAGGAHILSNCYNTGLALREGFANAVPHWVLDGENAADPDAGGFELESPSKANVCNGDTNEVWVAGVFWDLLDRHADGQDRLYFNNAVEVFSRYLNAGVKNGIKNYRSNYRGAASAGHADLIDAIYENNTIPVT